MLVLAVETIPLGILVSAALDRSLQRRSRFSVRFALFSVIVALPELVVLLGFAVGLIGEAAFSLVMCGLMWGLTLVALAPFLLFQGPRSNPGQWDDGGDDSAPENDRPTPPRPRGGIPLPDAEQSRRRLRGYSSARRAVLPRRSAREPKPTPSHLRLLLPRPRPIRRGA